MLTGSFKKNKQKHRFKTSRSAPGKKALGGKTHRLTGGRPPIDKVGPALQQIYKYLSSGKHVWEQLTGSDRRQFLSNWKKLESGDTNRDNAMKLMAYLQAAGLGTDCLGFVSQTLAKMGKVPPNMTIEMGSLATYTRTALKGVKGTRSTPTNKVRLKNTPKRRGKNTIRPCDNDGKPLLQSGDVILWEDAKHIALILRVAAITEDGKPAVLLEFGHSTPGQTMFVKGRKDDLGVRPEGVRADLVVWIHDPVGNPTTGGRWKVVRSRFKDAELNSGILVGFYRPKDIVSINKSVKQLEQRIEKRRKWKAAQKKK